MSADKEGLARRAVVAWEKCGLDWMPGVHARSIFDETHEDYTPPGVVISVVAVAPRVPPTCSVALDIGHDDGTQGERADFMLPNLDHPATLGCIEHGMLPAAWGPDVSITHIDGPGINRSFVVGPNGRPLFTVDGPKPDRFVACLEAAAERRNRDS